MYAVDIAAADPLQRRVPRVLHTSKHVQLVVMTLQPGEEIRAEVHEHNDQVLTFVKGTVRAEVGGETRDVGPGDVVVVPAGTRHNFADTGGAPARLHTSLRPARTLGRDGARHQGGSRRRGAALSTA